MKEFRSACSKIVAIGRNYAEHAAELRNPLPKRPVVFCKTANTFLSHKGEVVAPAGCRRLQHEVELAVVVGRPATNVPRRDAMAHVAGYALALDMTARDLQGELKEAKLPWYLAKSFDTSCPISDFIPADKVTDPHKLQLRCFVNEQLRQDGSTSDMIFPIGALIEFISKYVTLARGDLILTGTPAGVSDLADGDVVRCELRNADDAHSLAELQVDVRMPAARD